MEPPLWFHMSMARKTYRGKASESQVSFMSMDDESTILRTGEIEPMKWRRSHVFARHLLYVERRGCVSGKSALVQCPSNFEDANVFSARRSSHDTLCVDDTVVREMPPNPFRGEKGLVVEISIRDGTDHGNAGSHKMIVLTLYKACVCVLTTGPPLLSPLIILKPYRS